MNKKVKTYKPTIILRTLYKLIKNNIIKITKKKRIFEFLNKFLKGVNIHYNMYVVRNHFSIVLRSQKAVDVGKNQF